MSLTIICAIYFAVYIAIDVKKELYDSIVKISGLGNERQGQKKYALF